MSNKADSTGKYKEYKELNFPAFETEILQFWKENKIFEKSIENRKDKTPFVFYEGPPSANGLPGIHHVISRTIKDIFCRYKTLKGFNVKRKAGWDTHGLPIELQVEKKMGITKDDIGTKISIEDYNKACREDVLKFKDKWDELTERIGFWVDLDNPYVTYENEYIESCWNLLKKLYDKGFLYKGYTIQPFSPAAGTGLSSHELNQPGTYQDVKDTTVVAQFLLTESEQKIDLFGAMPVHFLAWTTTPWTLPSNTALAVGPKVDYTLIETFNAYTFEKIYVVLAVDLVGSYFKKEESELDINEYQQGDKKIPYRILKQFKGVDFVGLRFNQLLPYVLPAENPENAFQIIAGDFVTTVDGTGIVHIAPTFGADDARVAKQAGIPPMLIKNNEDKLVPLVDLQGRFVKEMGEFGGKFVKNEYYSSNAPERSVDVEIAIKLKEENKAFKVEKYEHSYPHCWRTDKPILYYPLESWFIKTTAVKDRLVELNKTINWKPKSTGEGRFGNWLENLVDWNLSRSRFWGTPLPIWRTEDGKQEKCIGSIEELNDEIELAIAAGFMSDNQYKDKTTLDLHRPFIDNVILVSASGEKMIREIDLIDVWFDSGAMPYAQVHYPFENQADIDDNLNFPADFIAEGVDQTRGWFFTLHAISVMLFDSIAYKNVVANGLVLDKNGNKMSKRLGNTVEPFSTIDKYGADAVRWYMLSNSNPWDNLKFDLDGLGETQRKLFSTLYNIYGFYALYANIDGFTYKEENIKYENRAEIDRWILSRLHSLIQEVDQSMDDYEPTKATRAIQEFVTDHLSNWYVRLCRRRFWKGEYSEDKIAAYQTLYECLETVSRLMSIFSPFYADKLFIDLNLVTKRFNQLPVHLVDFPLANSEYINKELEIRMGLAQDASSMILGIRKKLNLKVRQPLAKIMIPVLNDTQKERIRSVENLILSEVNVKEIQYLTDKDGEVIVKTAKPDFKKLGPKAGAKMKQINLAIQQLKGEDISQLEESGSLALNLDAENFILLIEDVEILSMDMPGWQVASEKGLTIALDINITEKLKLEGVARELVNRIQGFRKESNFVVTDRVDITLENGADIVETLNHFNDYICGETLADTIQVSNNVNFTNFVDINGVNIGIDILKK
jgi:isoleucyl-tRNA synthetase